MVKNNQTLTEIIYNTPHGPLDFSIPLVMGILNTSPDSFYSASLALEKKIIIERVATMIDEGADILDLGGATTRPGAVEPDKSEEINRVVNALKVIRSEFTDIPISVDTYRASVANAALNEGADVVNDISGGAFDSEMIPLISRMNVPYILMHLQGTRESMHRLYRYNSIHEETLAYFEDKTKTLHNAGVNKIIIDPGFGFSKQMEDNYRLLGVIGTLRKRLDYPVLVGISRKRMIQQVLGVDAEHSLNGTTAAHVIALMNGATILRVHDVKEAKEAIKITNFFLNLTINSDISLQT